MNKKGVSFKILNMTFFRMLFITLTFFVVFLFTSYQIQEKIEIQDIKNTVFITRALYSPTSFSYADIDTGRVFPGIIDMARFNDNQLNNSFYYSGNNMAARFEIKYIDSNKTKKAYLNKKYYDRWAPLTTFKKYSQTTKFRYILVQEEDELNKAVLRIDVVSLNE